MLCFAFNVFLLNFQTLNEFNMFTKIILEPSVDSVLYNFLITCCICVFNYSVYLHI